MEVIQATRRPISVEVLAFRLVIVVACQEKVVHQEEDSPQVEVPLEEVPPEEVALSRCQETMSLEV